MRKVIAFLNNESGATAIEYGLIAAGISVVIIATVNAIGSTLNAKFDYISPQLKSRSSTRGCKAAAPTGGFLFCLPPRARPLLDTIP